VRVSISYRGARLDEKRLISRLYLELDLLIRNGQIKFYPLTEPVEIRPGVTVLRGIDPETTGAGDSTGDGPPARELAADAHGGQAIVTPAGERREVDADFVYLATGFEMDQSLYEALGIRTEDEERKPVHDRATMESNVPGVFVVGTSIGGNQRGYKVFITTSHEHCLRAGRELVRRVLAGETGRELVEIEDSWVGNLGTRDYPLSSKDVE
jgi:thioredoxin reductase (NADPH)